MSTPPTTTICISEVKPGTLLEVVRYYGIYRLKQEFAAAPIEEIASVSRYVSITEYPSPTTTAPFLCVYFGHGEYLGTLWLKVLHPEYGTVIATVSYQEGIVYTAHDREKVTLL